MRPSLNVLGEDLTRRILDEAHRILAETGMEIRGKALRERLLELGLPVDDATGRILFPADVVERAIESAPSSFSLYDRDGNPHAELGGDAVHFVPGSSGLKVLDHRSGETRLATSADYVEYVRLADGLEHIAYLATAFSTADIEPQVSDAWRLYMTLLNSKQPVVSGAFGEHGVPRLASLLRLFRELLPEVAARVSTDDAALWAGLRPMSYDGRPFIGATEVDGLYVNGGHGPLGWTMAAGSAELLADLMTGQETAIDPAPFRLARS